MKNAQRIKDAEFFLKKKKKKIHSRRQRFRTQSSQFL